MDILIYFGSCQFGGAFAALWLHAHVMLHAELHDLNAQRRALNVKRDNGNKPVPDNGGARFALSAQDLASVVNGALMAAAGAAVAWLATNWLPKIDESTSTGFGALRRQHRD